MHGIDCKSYRITYIYIYIILNLKHNIFATTQVAHPLMVMTMVFRMRKRGDADINNDDVDDDDYVSPDDVVMIQR